MKIEKIDSPAYRMELTQKEFEALILFLGESSTSGMKGVGLSQEQADICYQIYSDMDDLR